jgi:plasmid maintenance system killer protein
MDVVFSTTKLQKICNSDAKMKAEFGPQMAGKLQQRLMELRAADTLAQISRVPPPRCHEHTGNNKGKLTVDLVHPYRLFFKPNHDPVPEKPDGGLEWEKVTSIVVLGIEDPH